MILSDLMVIVIIAGVTLIVIFGVDYMITLATGGKK